MWATTTPRGPAEPPRRTFALTGPSIRIDPLHNAVRGDLADIRLAECVFAPHYAAPMVCRVTLAAPLRIAAGDTSDVLAQLEKDETFEVLEVLREVAWGVSPDRRLAGYVERTALSRL